MKKTLNFSIKNDVSKYVVCPQCHHLYKESDCIVKELGKQVSLKCEFIKFPNHPHATRRRKCGTSLMKTVKLAQKYKLVPKKTFVYYNIIESLQMLIKVPGFLDSCEEWRSKKARSGVLFDV